MKAAQNADGAGMIHAEPVGPGKMTLQLSVAEARVLSALVEKSVTTPQYYPMSVNSVMLAANQKSNRNPVMTLTEAEVGHALNQLESEQLVQRDQNSGRVVKWRHRFHHQLLIQTPTLAVLATLMLRGPQTVAEIRTHAGSLNGPGDADNTVAILRDLMDRAQPLVCELPRQTGQSAPRWMHLLCGEPDLSQFAQNDSSASSSALDQRVAQLEARLAELEARLEALESR